MTSEELIDILHNIEPGNRSYEYTLTKQEYEEIKQEVGREFDSVAVYYGDIFIKVKE
jgi:hypothetical protein